MNTKILEICCANIESVENAYNSGVTRVELCSNLECGGTTPSYGLIKKARSFLNLEVVVLIRPRSGNFSYSKSELEIIKDDIKLCKDLGCQGVVVGFLTEHNQIDTTMLEEVVDLAQPMDVIFNKAFDFTPNLSQSLEILISHGVKRVLTTGKANNVANGILTLQKLIAQAKGRIKVMPGGGINSSNISELLLKLDTTEFHGSFKQLDHKFEVFGTHEVSDSLDICKSLQFLAQ